MLPSSAPSIDENRDERTEFTSINGGDEGFEEVMGGGDADGDRGSGSLRETCDELAVRVNGFLETEAETEVLRGVQRRTRGAVEVIHEALERYSLSEISLSYNGGKDCLVLLIIYLAALSPKIHLTPPRTKHPLYPTNDPTTTANPLPPLLPSIHIIPPHPFPEVLSFVATTSRTYHLSLTHSSLPMLPAFTTYLASHPTIRAILVGTRRTDPHGQFLSAFNETDGDWPRFMRIHPVLDWHYREIWAFIRELGVGYCGLYDRGYTSLGGVRDTRPNPVLVRGGGEGEGFRPAWELVEDGEERLGRE